ncbi:ABC transporter permease [Glaciecola sp. 1036]|uniref:ABC transporter permease n=1 Tax=Alteromonadaceae TaxID=72275 RepID=UPI003CFE73D8
MNRLSRLWAILIKEFIQMRRDRMTFAMMLGIPIIQLILFGFAINNDPKQLPAAIYAEEDTHFTRAILSGFAASRYFNFEHVVKDLDQAQTLMKKGEIAFIVTIQAGFSRDLVNGLKPQLLIIADASDPAVSSNALGQAANIVNNALRHDLTGHLANLQSKTGPVELVIHRKFNPENITQYNIVPGLLGVILTMTSVMITAMAMTRERERGNLENILAMPAQPLEVMLGKIFPYVLVGAVQTLIIILAARYIFDVPFIGYVLLLLSGVILFIIANLCLGFTFSTIAKSQMQAMQLTFFFFLPSILLSGFMFPFWGMPKWAQFIGEALPLTHFLRIVRGVMLKGANWQHLATEFYAILIFTLVMGLLAILRYQRTLD